MESLSIDSQLVWMTCGIDAGYQILLAPPEGSKSWIDLLEGAFPNFELGGSNLKTVEINYDGNKALALAFFDPELCDASSRPIKHFMLFLGLNESVIKRAPSLLIEPLLQQLAPAFREICRASRYSSEQDIMKLAQNKQTERIIHLEFKSKLATVAAVVSKKVEASKAAPNRATAAHGQDTIEEHEALSMPAWLKWAFVVVILLAVVIGFVVGA